MMPTTRADLGTMGSEITYKAMTSNKEHIRVVIRETGESVEGETIHRHEHWNREHGMLIEFHPVDVMVIGEVFGKRHDVLN
jgi:hypothetical protein